MMFVDLVQALVSRRHSDSREILEFPPHLSTQQRILAQLSGNKHTGLLEKVFRRVGLLIVGITKGFGMDQRRKVWVFWEEVFCALPNTECIECNFVRF